MSRRLKKGFGQGEGKDYKPWLRVSDVPSSGTCTILTGWKDGIEHHLLSRPERNYFYLLEWNDHVITIHEQFPLLPLEATLEIAAALGIRHPHVKGEPVLMTTDFMITVGVNGKATEKARTVKLTKHLTRRRVLEKFEIERRYFAERGIDWGIVTELEIPEPLWRNIDWVHECRDIRCLAPLHKNEVRRISEYLGRKILTMRAVVLATFCLEADDALGVEPGTALKVVRFLIANKVLCVDMTRRIKTDDATFVVVRSMHQLWS